MSLILDGTNGLSDVDGTAAAPAIRGTDANTGIFFGTDIIGFSEGGVESARFNADAQFVAAAGTAALPVITTTGDVNTGIFFPAADTVAVSTGGTERARIDSSGQFFVGTTSNPGGGTSVAAFSGADVLNVNNTVAGTGSVTSVYFKRNATTVGSITVTGSATAYVTSSDYRLKENIAPMTGALAKIAALKPVTYKWKIDGSDGQGFIAHELNEVVPDCVSGEKDAVQEQQYEVTPAVTDEEGNTITEAVMGTRTVPKYQGIDTSFLSATLTAALQELHAIVKAQAVEIADLKARLP